MCGHFPNQLLVYGAGAVIPSTFVELEKGRVYSAVIELAPEVPRGRVNVVIAKRACADAAGNFFQRTDNSTFVIHFGCFLLLPAEMSFLCHSFLVIVFCT